MGVPVLVVAAVAALAIVYPQVGAVTCPRCYGFERVRDGLYAEGGASGAQRELLVGVFEQANARVDEYYGGKVTAPAIVACFSDGCYERIGGGGEKGVAVLNRAVMLSPRGIDTVIAAHEMSHVELDERLRGDAKVPQWFDEGLAVVVSDDSRYLLPVTTAGAERCRVEPDGPLPESLGAWLKAAGADVMTYAKAACATTRVLKRITLPQLVDRLNAGESFGAITGA